MFLLIHRVCHLNLFMFVSIRQSELPFMKAAKIKNFVDKTNIRQIKLKKLVKSSPKPSAASTFLF